MLVEPGTIDGYALNEIGKLNISNRCNFYCFFTCICSITGMIINMHWLNNGLCNWRNGGSAGSGGLFCHLILWLRGDKYRALYGFIAVDKRL